MKQYTYISKIALISTIIASASPVVGSDHTPPMPDEDANPHHHNYNYQQQPPLDELLQQRVSKKKEQQERRRYEQKRIKAELSSPVKYNYIRTPQSPKKGVR